MRFLANENFPLQSVRILRQADLEVASVTEDSPGIEDAEVLARAADEQRVILTFDRACGELIYPLRLRSPRGVIYSVFQFYEVGTRGPVPCPYGGDRAICGILHKPGIRCMISEKASDVILASAKNQKILPVYESK